MRPITRHRLTRSLRTLSASLPAAAGLALLGVLLLAAAPAAAQNYGTHEYGTYDPTYEPAGYASPQAQGGPQEALPAEGGSYSYFRVVEGPATLTQGDTGEEQTVEPNQPALVGDRLWVPPGSRLEMVLSDGNLLRLGGGTGVVFEGLADSPDTAGRETVLRLLTGHLQLVVLDDRAADVPPRIETGSATLYTRGQGVYRVTAEGSDHARLTVRDGSAELVTRRGSLVVRAGEQAWVDGGEWPRAGIQTAAEPDALEIWGERLVAEAELASADPAGYDSLSLRYAAAPLRDYGDWVVVGGSRAWKPRVEADWRPYWYGNWSYTPSGWLWVSSEPWGWVPYHYGSWNLDPLYGWVWYPGDVFAPAWVYWYWGPSQVAWVPVGYYSHYYYDRFYAPRHRSFFGFHFGLYGYAGGHAAYYRHWVFCPIDRFGHHGHGRYGHAGRYGGRHGDFYHGDDFERRSRRDVVPRGVITTDTRGITRERLLRPVQLVDDLGRRPSSRRLAGPRGELPDVTSFVAREPELSPELRTRLVAQTPDQGSRLAGTPLRPGTASRKVTRATPHNPGPATRALTPPSPDRGTDRGTDLRGDRTPTAVRPGAPSRPSSVRPSRPSAGDRTPNRIRPQTPAAPRRPTSVRPSTPTPQRPSSVRPSSPSRPSSVRPATPSRPSSVRPPTPTPQRPSSVRPSSPSRPSSVRPVTPSRPSSVRPSAPAAPSRRPSAVRPTSPSRSPSSRAAPSSPRGSRRPSASRPPARRSSPRAGSGGGRPASRSSAVRSGGGRSSSSARGSTRGSSGRSSARSSSGHSSGRGRSASSRSGSRSRSGSGGRSRRGGGG